MLQLDIIDETGGLEDDVESLVSELLQFALKEEKMTGDIEVSVTFMSDEAIQVVNKEYRGKDTPTDVISFALEEMGEGELQIIKDQNMPIILGDILISVDTAKRQAVEYNHPLIREIGFLALHGLLHLLGYDHMTEEEEKVMFGRQKEILDAFGLER